ncbi:MAG TPA: CheR family methyltransferase, partial [Nitrosospira sp.]|nr:CheR family methyltransferase [Nitrosospira sp.]
MSNSSGQSAAGELPESGATPLLVVGIGASAGGIQALQEFFENVPADSSIAYVVILHLSPEHESRLASVLQTVCAIPVTQMVEKVHVEPDHVYVIPPDKHLTMSDGYIEVSANISMEERRAPVDIFFRTLAEAKGPRAVCVVLSGTGADGSMGLKRVKERGGAAFVQSPAEAEWDEMPRNALATSLVDSVLPIAEIPRRIAAYKERLGKIEIPLESDQRPEEQQQALREIFTQLRLRTGHDFSSYKRPTLLRRIERRINVRALPNLAAYAALCQTDQGETQALLKDLLISVTNFFRDRAAFEYIDQEIVPRILKGKKTHDTVRIWVVGCATGEEAYSLAMLCCERTLGVIDAPNFQIFATDIDAGAIAKAREGFYSLNDAADVSPERLHRFFTKEGDNFRIKREVRESILFANHNVLRDPPFSRVDLVSCRNMLIYLDYVAQERVLETMHFALSPGGYLFLGTSESMDGVSDLFAPVSREHHIFQSRAVAGRHFPVPHARPSHDDKPMASSSASATDRGNRGN